jgi:hypothetical protein
MLRFRTSPAGVPLMSGQVTIEVEARQGTTIIVVKGELDLVTMPFLAARLALASHDRPGRLVFDLSGTHFMVSIQDVRHALDELGKLSFGEMRVEDAMRHIVQTTHAIFSVDGAGLMLADAIRADGEN